MTDLLKALLDPPSLLWDGPDTIPGGIMTDHTQPGSDDDIDPKDITGYLSVPLPGRQSDSTDLAWTGHWPPPRLLAVVITQPGRFPARAVAMDATDWIDGTTIVPNADIAYFYVLAELIPARAVHGLVDIITQQPKELLLQDHRARYNRVLGVTVGSPS